MLFGPTKLVCSRLFSRKIQTIPKTTSRLASEATFDTKPYQLHKLDKGPAASATLTSKDALNYYTTMQVIRRMENNAAQLYTQKIIRGFCHLYAGEEAVAVGIKSVMRPQDGVITAYRAHGWTYLSGISVLEVLSELTGRVTGVSRAKGGSMHTYGINFYGGNGIVGAQVPLGVGIAFAAQYKGNKGVCFACYGDGAANQGQVAEVFNMAMLFKIPVIFVCENNGYGMGTSNDRAAANTAYYTRGDAVPGIWVDGMDILTVREGARFAIEHCVSGKGPIVMETATYRYFGHSMSDPGTSYRSREEIQKVRQSRDPIMRFKELIVGAKLVTEDEIKKADDDVKKEVDDATEKAKTGPEPPLAALSEDIYAKILEPKVRDVLPWNTLPAVNKGKPINLS